MKKVISFILALILTAIPTCCAFGFNKDTIEHIDKNLIEDSITITFSNEAEKSENYNVTKDFYSSESLRFFKENNLDINFYEKWILKQNIENLESLSITVMKPNDPNTLDIEEKANIQGLRMVYVETIATNTTRRVEFEQGEIFKNLLLEIFSIVIEQIVQEFTSLASFLGILDVGAYGNYVVIQGDDGYTEDASVRTVTKFVELKVPVSGAFIWQAYGYAQSYYARFGINLFHRGSFVKHNDKYRQYYTQNYYNETALQNKAVDAYPDIYEEVPSEVSAAYGNYTYHERDISSSKFYEYENLCT